MEDGAERVRSLLDESGEIANRDVARVRTRSTIKLAALGTSLISRSEAKRLVERLAEFQHAVLDFSGVDAVGQGFCDEVFRIFAREHPEVILEPVGMSDAVGFMVARASRRAQDEST